MQIIKANMMLPQVGKGEAINRPIPATANQTNTNISDFGNALERAASKNAELQFSKHANMRLSARNIRLDAGQMARIEDGVQAARAKGIRDSLVLVDDVALVVNIKNGLVVTALNQGNDHVFTNIDGAVIV